MRCSSGGWPSVAVVGFVLTIAAGCATQRTGGSATSARARELADKAEGEWRKGNFETAAGLFEKAVAADPRPTRPRYGLALVRVKQGRPAQAEALLLGLLADIPDDASLHATLARVKLLLGDAPAAVTVARRASSLAPEREEISLLLADALRQVGRRAEACSTLRELTGRMPESAQALKGVGRCHLDDGEPARAREFFERAVAIRAADEEAWLLLGKAAEAAGDDEAAGDAWRKTLRIDPGNADARVRLADLYRRTGRAAEAQQAVADLSSWSRDAEAAFRLALYYARSNAREKALEQAAIAVRSRPDDTALLEKMAGLQTWLGDREAAVATLERLLVASPGRHDARLSAGALLRELGRTDDALRHCQAVIDALPRAGEAYVQGALTLAAAGRTAEALAFLEPGLELLPQWPRLVFHRGLLRDRAGDAAGAERDFRETLRLDPKHAGAGNALGYLYARQGVRLDDAVALIEAALLTDPANPGYLDSLGWAYYRRGDTQQALATFGQALEKRRDDALIREHLAEVCRSLEDPDGAPECREPASAPPSPAAPSSAP